VSQEANAEFSSRATLGELVGIASSIIVPDCKVSDGSNGLDFSLSIFVDVPLTVFFEDAASAVAKFLLGFCDDLLKVFIKLNLLEFPLAFAVLNVWRSVVDLKLFVTLFMTLLIWFLLNATQFQNPCMGTRAPANKTNP